MCDSYFVLFMRILIICIIAVLYWIYFLSIYSFAFPVEEVMFNLYHYDSQMGRKVRTFLAFECYVMSFLKIVICNLLF